MSGLRTAVAFLTRVPVAGPDCRADLARAVPWFPIVGAAIGGAIGAVYMGGARLWSPLLAATVAITVHAFLTGAFHEDGLADTADAFGGGWTREERLQILKDPTHGTYGVIALVAAFALRVGTLAALDPATGLLVLVGAHALSRAASVGLLIFARPAGAGLGAAYGAAVERRSALVGVGAGVGIGAIFLQLLAVPAVALSLLAALGMGRLAQTKIGGVTGDVLGATQQVAEIAILLAAAAGLAEGIVLGA